VDIPLFEFLKVWLDLKSILDYWRNLSETSTLIRDQKNFVENRDFYDTM